MATRPVLTRSSFSSGSFLQDHQQYRPAASTSPPAQTNIDNILDKSPEDAAVQSPLVLNGQQPAPQTQGEKEKRPSLSHHPSQAKHQPVKESGIVHSIFSDSLATLPTGESKVVATIFYKGTHHAQSKDTEAVPPGSAPTVNMGDLPREPPVDPQPQPLDHLYGPYVSQLCLTHFLQIMEEMSTPYQRMGSSHRCLDRDDQPRIVEVTISPAPNPEYLPFDSLRRHENIWRFEREWNVEVVLQPESVFRKHKRLAVFDMDSTLIQQEVIDEIARFIGVEDQVSAITERAMNGELDFAASLQERVKLLKGVPADVFEQLKSRITIAPGARELCRALKRLGYKMAVLSGGFQPLADWLARELGLDYAFANHLEIDSSGQTLTGALVPSYPIIDATQKRSLLLSLAADNGISLAQSLAVGDGANDLLMLGAAGLGVAWRAKPKVQLEAPARLNGDSLVEVLYLLGLEEPEVKEVLAE